jgi:sugar lactone lactonase YvrE
MATLSSSPVVLSACELGEGPLWDAEREQLVWLDIPRRAAHTFAPASGLHRTSMLPWQVSCIVADRGDGFVLAGARGVWRAGADLQPTEQLAELALVEGTRTNDGGCDPQGRLWIGSADDRADGTRGGLWRVSDDGTVERVRSSISMSNGIGWTADGLRCFHVDTRAHAVDVLTLDAQGDLVATDRFADVDGMPDGLAVDLEGGVWLAVWDRAEVRRYAPDGRIDTVIPVDGGFVTSCAFGPPGTRRLYITTASQLDPDGPVSAGALFSAEVGIDGAPVGRFGTVG